MIRNEGRKIEFPVWPCAYLTRVEFGSWFR